LPKPVEKAVIYVFIIKEVGVTNDGNGGLPVVVLSYGCTLTVDNSGEFARQLYWLA
jgi:hypothetical protein